MTALPIALAAVEHERLAKLEAVIARGLDTFMEVGTALGEIRDARFYRFSHATFEAYLHERWSMSRAYAHRVIEASQVASMLPVGNIPNEAVARELVPVMRSEPTALGDVWAEATERSGGEAPTAAIVREVVQGRAHVANNTGETEWFTPGPYIVAARQVMGGIDLDPASTAIANRIVGASRFYTAADDGLSRPWSGRVWLNPPYSHPGVRLFAERVVGEVEAGNVSEVCVLVNNATETDWFQHMAAVSTAMCFPNGRIRFWHPERESITPLQGQAVLYAGPNVQRFHDAFGPFGLTVEAAR